MTYKPHELMACQSRGFMGHWFLSTRIDIAAQAIKIPSDHFARSELRPSSVLSPRMGVFLLRPRGAEHIMSGREEFDWQRMRQEEDDYFAARHAEPRSIKDVGEAVMRKARQVEHRPDYEVEELARLKDLPYADYLQSEHWKARSGIARERDGHQCRDCGAKQNLDVHHLTYDRLGEERLDDLITLCRGCHLARHP